MNPDSTLPHLFCQTLRSHAPIDQRPHLCYEIRPREGGSRSPIPERSAVNPFALGKTMRGGKSCSSEWFGVEPTNFPTLSFQSCNRTQKIAKRRLTGSSWQDWATKLILSLFSNFSLKQVKDRLICHIKESKISNHYQIQVSMPGPRPVGLLPD